MTSRVDVLVIGAGQTGLALGQLLSRRGHRFQLVDAGAEIGDSWRTRWDSLRLFTPAQYDGLPGLPFPAPADTYPTKDEVAAYLRLYAEEFRLPVMLNTKVESLTRNGDGYTAATRDEHWQAGQVVVATGAFATPFVPALSGELDPGVHQLHSVDYRNPDALPAGRVLVVGGGNTGCQIAHELSATRPVDLAVGRRFPTVPQRTLGRDLWWWASGLRLDRVNLDSRLGRRMSARDVLIGAGPKQLARRHGVGLRPRALRATGRSLTFADDTTAEYDVVLWATGFTPGHGWIDVPDLTDDRGRVRHRRGVTPSPGLYLLGQQWQYTRGSALLGWVASDAAYIADRIDAHQEDG